MCRLFSFFLGMGLVFSLRVRVMAADAEPGAENGRSFLVFPVAARLEGVGSFFGLGGRVSRITGKHVDVLAVRTVGQVDGYGAGLTRIPLFSDALEMNAFGFNLAKGRLVTSYGRGIHDSDDEVTQYLQGNGIRLGVDYSMLDRRLKWSFSTLMTTLSISRFDDRQGEEIILPNANLKNIRTQQYDLGARYQDLDNPFVPRSGYRAGLVLTALRGRSGQSDQLASTVQLTRYVPLGPLFTSVGALSGSDAAVIVKAPRYDTEEEVREALQSDCASAGSSTAEERCSQLSARISRFVAASNRRGTAPALGGSASLRAYREQRFRATYSHLAAAEARFHAAKALGIQGLSGDGRTVDLDVFYEFATAADFQSELYRAYRRSVGGGARLVARDLTVRLEAAVGDEGTAWFLTAGNAL